MKYISSMCYPIAFRMIPVFGKGITVYWPGQVVREGLLSFLINRHGMASETDLSISPVNFMAAFRWPRR